LTKVECKQPQKWLFFNLTIRISVKIFLSKIDINCCLLQNNDKTYFLSIFEIQWTSKIIGLFFLKKKSPIILRLADMKKIRTHHCFFLYIKIWFFGSRHKLGDGKSIFLLQTQKCNFFLRQKEKEKKSSGKPKKLALFSVKKKNRTDIWIYKILGISLRKKWNIFFNNEFVFIWSLKGSDWFKLSAMLYYVRKNCFR